MQKDALDNLLFVLADQFEAGDRRHWYGFPDTDSHQLESWRKCIAELYAEGSVDTTSSGERFQFTESGYTRYLSRIEALRGLAASAGR
jgi:hypothetical protein